MNNKEQVPAIHRYKIGFHSDEWGMRSGTPAGIHDASGSWVRYSDHVAVIAALRAQQVRISELEAELATTHRRIEMLTEIEQSGEGLRYGLECLITTDQAEAYANDRVSEAMNKLEAAPAQCTPLSVEAIAEIAERLEVPDPTDSFWVELCRAFEEASVSGNTQEKQG